MPRSARANRLSAWGRLVAASAMVVALAALVLGVWSVASGSERRVSYTVDGELNGLSLDLGDADVVVVGGGGRRTVTVEHVDRYGFGHGPEARRSVSGGVFRVRSRCPRTLMHGCSVSYRVAVPDNLPLQITTQTGTVTLRGYRGSARIMTGDGDINVAGFCGFLLQARAGGAGNVEAETECAPPQLALRSTTGSVLARVPAGRYRVDASTAGGRPLVRGIVEATDAPFTIQALSSSGPVTVERRP